MTLVNPSTHNSVLYDSTMRLITGQMVSRLEPCVTVKTHTGGGLDVMTDAVEFETREAATGDQYYVDTPIQDVGRSRRRIRIKYAHDGILVDDAEKAVFNPADPSNEKMLAVAKAINITQDRDIMAAITGTAFGGQTGADAITLPGTGQNRVLQNSWPWGGGSGNAGLTISKVIEAKSNLIKMNDLDTTDFASEQIWFAVTQDQIDDMLQYTETTDKNFTDLQALQTGKVDRFLGVNFVRLGASHIARVGDVRQNPMWMKSGIEFRKGRELHQQTVRGDKSGADQYYSRRYYGATRLMERKVVVVECLQRSGT